MTASFHQRETQLDHTRIAIRERGLLDIFDLALHVIREYPGALLATWLLGTVPLMVINDWLVGWILNVEFQEAFFYEEEWPAIWRFWWNMTLLVVIEAPLASIFMTAYLGQAVFTDRPDLRQIVYDTCRRFPLVAWSQLLIRGILAAWLLLLLVERGEDFNWAVELFLLTFVAFYASLLRAFWPFINEIILLERSPLRATDPETTTLGRRSIQLHGPSGADLFSRWLASAVVAVMLSFAVLGTIEFCLGVLFNNWLPGPTALRYLYPLGLWIVAGYLSVVRFLSYLDIRIRHEGWEVELRLRAESVRQTAKLV